MKLNPQIIKLAKKELDQHLLTDLNYASEFRRFMDRNIGAEEYLNSTSGFKRFLYDYKVGRTLQGGDDAKLKILAMIRDYNFVKPQAATIHSLANAIKDKRLSSMSGNGRHGLPQSFASKLLSVYKPDEVIPYDSYALKSIEHHINKKLKDLSSYYEAIENFRAQYFPEKSKDVELIRKNIDRSIRQKMDELRLDAGMLLSWKLTDKYLWCDHSVRRMK